MSTVVEDMTEELFDQSNANRISQKTVKTPYKDKELKNRNYTNTAGYANALHGLDYPISAEQNGDDETLYVDPRILERALHYAIDYGNERIVKRTLPGDEFPEGVVGFTHANPEIPEFFSIPSERTPYINGIHAGKAIDMHEQMHIIIAKYGLNGGMHDERGINNYVAAKLGYAFFPFPSY